MKTILKRALLIVATLIVIVIVAAGAYAAYARSVDARYHAGLSKSFQVTSTSFEPEHEMPAQYSCKGAGVSPEIGWTGAPADTKSYALLTTDWDAPSPSVKLMTVSHWVLYNIPAGITEIAASATNADLKTLGISLGLNISGGEGYTPPCPPVGTHQYIFRVYALDIDKVQPASNTRSGVMNAMQGHILGYGQLIGLKSPG